MRHPRLRFRLSLLIAALLSVVAASAVVWSRVASMESRGDLGRRGHHSTLAREYRRLARTCLEMAEDEPAPGRRKGLLSEAEQWDGLAAYHERQREYYKPP